MEYSKFKYSDCRYRVSLFIMKQRCAKTEKRKEEESRSRLQNIFQWKPTKIKYFFSSHRTRGRFIVFLVFVFYIVAVALSSYYAVLALHPTRGNSQTRTERRLRVHHGRFYRGTHTRIRKYTCVYALTRVRVPRRPRYSATPNTGCDDTRALGPTHSRDVSPVPSVPPFSRFSLGRSGALRVRTFPPPPLPLLSPLQRLTVVGPLFTLVVLAMASRGVPGMLASHLLGPFRRRARRGVRFRGRVPRGFSRVSTTILAAVLRTYASPLRFACARARARALLSRLSFYFFSSSTSHIYLALVRDVIPRMTMQQQQQQQQQRQRWRRWWGRWRCRVVAWAEDRCTHAAGKRERRKKKEKTRYILARPF